MRTITDLQRLVKDIRSNSVQEYGTVNQAEDRVREAMREACGGEWNFYNFQANKWSVYSVMREVLDLEVETIIEDQFNEFVEVKNTNLGDTIEFDVEDDSLFRVASIAKGTTDIRRQRLDAGVLTVKTEKLAVKIYAEWDRFMAGRVDLSAMISRVLSHSTTR
jgi:hypothetical protein